MKRADSAAGKATAGGSEAHGAQQHHGRVSDTDRSVSRPAAAPSRTHSRPPQSISDSSMAQPRHEGMGAAAGASSRAAAGAAGAPNPQSRAPPLLSRPLQRSALLPPRQPPPQRQPAPQPPRQPLQQQQAPPQPKAQQQRQMPPVASGAHSIQPTRVQLPQPPRTSTASAVAAASARSAVATAAAAAHAQRQLAPPKPVADRGLSIAQPAAPKQLQQTDKSKQKQSINAGAAIAAAADQSKNSSTSRVQGKRPGSKLSAAAANDEDAAAAPSVKKARVAAKREDEKGHPKAEGSTSAAAAKVSKDGGLGAAPHVDEAAAIACAAPLPTKHPQRTYSLFSPDVLCEVVLLGEEREQIAAQLNWTPSANSDSDGELEGEEEDNVGDDDWLPSNKSKPLHARGAPMSEADSIGDEQAADTDAERGPDLMSWLQCVLHSSSPDRMWGCWCGMQPYATFRVVRRHIREAHAGIVDPPSPVAASSRGPGSSGQLAEDASGPSGLLQPIAMRSNVRVQLPPPPMQGRQVRTQ